MELHHSAAISSFDRKNDRIDDFFSCRFGSNAKFKTLWFAAKLIIILSHGLSSIEGGFLTNKDILRDDMTKASLKAYRQVYDGFIHLSKHSGSSKEKETEKENKIGVSNITI